MCPRRVDLCSLYVKGTASRRRSRLSSSNNDFLWGFAEGTLALCAVKQPYINLHPTRVVRVVIVEEPRAALSCSQQEDTNSKIQGGYVNGQIVRENIHLQSSH